MARSFQEMGSRISSVLLIVFLCISVLLMVCFSREGEEGLLHGLQSRFLMVSTPIQTIGAYAGAGIEAAQEGAADASASEETLSALRDRNEELTNLLTQAEEYRLEAERLRGLLDIKDAYDIEGVTGNVIGRSSDAWNQTITIDVGSANGVENGMSVMGPNGVIGQIISTSPGSSVVRLLSDPKSGAAAMVQSSRTDGVVRGSLTGSLYLTNVEAGSSLAVGDVILTSGLGGSYIKGLLIGTIVRIDGSPTDGTQSILVAANEEVSSLEEVIVVFSASSDVTVSTVPKASADTSSGGEGDEASNQAGGES